MMQAAAVTSVKHVVAKCVAGDSSVSTGGGCTSIDITSLLNALWSARIGPSWLLREARHNKDRFDDQKG